MAHALTPKKRQAERTAQSTEKKRRVSQQSGAPSLEVACWVTVCPPSRKKVDALKASVPCLITSICADSDTATVLYPNRLSLFLQQADGGTVRFRTESVAVSRLCACKAEDVSALDRKMVQILCSVISERKADPSAKVVAKAEALCEDGSAASAAAAQPSPVAELDKDKLQAFTRCVAKAFLDARRSILQKSQLCTNLVDAGFTQAEVEIGLVRLDDLCKIMISDDTVFRV
eukprot:TRINITY_DN94003_c0_g1_i1.p1 TRINITY_DN94003_c0_g1~~TRINITY_DN94003_c0_g1_i1.p1  ORF type:complete len:241 (-),score=48.92 TRINITY_DN94003_c0_g1_i1:46-738(-)